jgi:ferredoxin
VAAGRSERIFEIAQEPQVAVVADLCNECGNCATFCPTAGRPWRDKPRLYFHRPSFESEVENAFMLLSIGGAPAIQGMFEGALHQLVDDDELDYHTSNLAATLDRDSLDVLEIRSTALEPGDDLPSLEPCAVLWALLRGLTGSMPHLPVPEADPRWLVARC